MENFIDKEKNIIIDDTFLLPHEISAVYQGMLNLDYRLNPGTGTPDNNREGISGKEYLDYPMMVSGQNAFVLEDPVSQISLFLLDKFSKKHKINIKSIYRAKSNITFTTLHGKSSNPHIDTQANHFVFLYYVNDSDGDTILFDNVYDGFDKDAKELKVLKHVTPKAGRVVWFKGNRYHSWIAPKTSSYRMVINMNVEAND